MTRVATRRDKGPNFDTSNAIQQASEAPFRQDIGLIGLGRIDSFSTYPNMSDESDHSGHLASISTKNYTFAITWNALVGATPRGHRTQLWARPWLYEGGSEHLQPESHRESRRIVRRRAEPVPLSAYQLALNPLIAAYGNRFLDRVSHEMLADDRTLGCFVTQLTVDLTNDCRRVFESILASGICFEQLADGLESREASTSIDLASIESLHRYMAQWDTSHPGATKTPPPNTDFHIVGWPERALEEGRSEGVIASRLIQRPQSDRLLRRWLIPNVSYPCDIRKQDVSTQWKTSMLPGGEAFAYLEGSLNTRSQSLSTDHQFTRRDRLGPLPQTNEVV